MSNDKKDIEEQCKPDMAMDKLGVREYEDPLRVASNTNVHQGTAKVAKAMGLNM